MLSEHAKLAMPDIFLFFAKGILSLLKKAHLTKAGKRSVALLQTASGEGL